MHCDKCNIDFPEGLRYCKWCGDPLIDRPRVTSELHACPSCSTAVQPTWAYCKSCGQPLHAAASQSDDNDSPGRSARRAQDSIDTAVIAKCPSCGEKLDTGSLYCKSCGSAVYAQQAFFGASGLLCATCNSYSPRGSHVCRVCGTTFIQAPQTVVDMPAPSLPIRHKSETFRDLDHVSRQEAETRLHQIPDFDSHAKGVETSFLPGTAGSRSEQQTPTGEVQMGRTTGPVEEDAKGDQTPTASGELAQESSYVIETTPSPGDIKPPPPPVLEATLNFGSESAGQTPTSESKTEVFVSPVAPHARAKVSQDDLQTQQFAPDRWQDVQETREFQSPAKTPSEVAAPASPTQPVRAEFARARATPEFPVAKTASTPIAQVPAAALPKKRGGAFIASVIVALIVIGGAIYAAWWLLFSHRRPAPPPTTQVKVEQPPVTLEPRVTPPNPDLPEGMVAVAAGSYTIGRDSEDPTALERPQHKVDLTAFNIDRTEVTNSAYKKFVDATGHKNPTNWSGGKLPEAREDFPVTGVTWQDAADYAAWAGKRLPTEAEWEAAARGAEGRIYPWGNSFRAGVANIGVTPDKPGPEQYPKGIKEVGRYPDGASPVGAVDMIGNVWEWVADEFKLYSGGPSTIPTDIREKMEPDRTYRVIRGGAYDGNKDHNATYRGLLDASQAYPKVGFRCAKDAK